MSGETKSHGRLVGLDLARFIALVGMIIVNFKMVMVSLGAPASASSPFSGLSLWDLVEGRAAAIFVVLAGLGLSLSVANKAWDATVPTIIRRSVFLMVLGLLNSLIFDADILHYYAIYFFFGVWFVKAPAKVLWAAIFCVTAGFVGLNFILDYDVGWNWTDYTYSDFWSPTGFMRNLFFNGWNPVVPWFALLLFGIWLSRLNLDNKRVQMALVLAGLIVFTLIMFTSTVLTNIFGPEDADAVFLFTTSPVPPMPLFILAGGSAASVIVGICLLMVPLIKNQSVLEVFAMPGRQTLTLYIAHILIGMGILEELNMIGGQSYSSALIAALVFCGFAVIYATIWGCFFKRGPLETLMRRIAG